MQKEDCIAICLAPLYLLCLLCILDLHCAQSILAYRQHTKHLLSAFYKTIPSKKPSKNPAFAEKPLQAPSKNPSKKHLLLENLLRTFLRSVRLHDPLGVHPIAGGWTSIGDLFGILSWSSFLGYPTLARYKLNFFFFFLFTHLIQVVDRCFDLASGDGGDGPRRARQGCR